MKLTTLLSASIAVLATAHFAQADVTVHITGSTAFRAATSNAIRNVMTFGGTGQGYAYNGTSFTGATYQIFKGSVTGVAGTVTVKTQWSGSVSGIRDVSLGNTIDFLPSTTTVSSGGTANAPLTDGATPPNSILVKELAEIALADNTQASTIYKSPAINVKAQVGIVPFAFVVGAGAPANVTNISAQLAKALLGVGSIPASQFTGNAADTRPLYAVGRDTGSGTRLTTLAESGYGAQTPTQQFQVTGTSGNSVTSIDIWPGATPGNEGVTSGGTLATYLRYDTNSVSDSFNGYTGPLSFVGYLGENDSYTAVYGSNANFNTPTAGTNARYLTYNGVAGFGGQAVKPATVTTDGTAVIKVTSAEDLSGIVAGQIVSGNGIAPGSTVVSVNLAATPKTITLDKVTTAGTVASPATSTNVVVGALLPAAIRNGQYTFWNYEYILWKSAVIGTTGDAFTVATKIRDRILNNDYGFSGLADDAAMKVQRGTDGGAVVPK